MKTKLTPHYPLLWTTALTCALLLGGISVTASGASPASYQKNTHGETFGSVSQAVPAPSALELILAEGVNGKTGYMRNSEVNPLPASPQEALQWQKDNKDGRYVSLYSSDGETVVDQFFLSPEQEYADL